MLIIFMGPGLPDGIFSKQNPNSDKFWRALEWKRLVHIFNSHFEYTFYGHLVYILWPFGNEVAIRYIFHQFWYTIVSRKSWQPFTGMLLIILSDIFYDFQSFFPQIITITVHLEFRTTALQDLKPNTLPGV
jgi:hypothetical protein